MVHAPELCRILTMEMLLNIWSLHDNCHHVWIICLKIECFSLKLHVIVI